MVPSGEMNSGAAFLVPGFPKPGAPFKILHLPSKQLDIPNPWHQETRNLYFQSQNLFESWTIFKDNFFLQKWERKAVRNCNI